MTKQQAYERLRELACKRAGDDERWIREAAARVIRAYPNGGDDVRILRRPKVTAYLGGAAPDPWSMSEPMSVVVPRAGASEFDACIVVEEQIRAQVDD